MPSTPASEAVLRGQDFYRVFENIAPFTGLFFDVDESVAGVSVGPESDIDLFSLTYLDKTGTLPLPGFNKFVVSPDSPWINTVFSAPAQQYPLGGGPGVIHVEAPSIQFNAMRRVPFGFFTTLNVDLIFHLKRPNGDYPKRRSPRTHLVGFANFFSGGPGTLIGQIPFYGRRQFNWNSQFTAQFVGGPNTVDIQITGIKIMENTAADQRIVVPLASVVALPITGVFTFDMLDRDFDAIEVRGNLNGPAGIIRLARTMQARD